MTDWPDTLATAAAALRSGRLKALDLLAAAADHDRELHAYVEFDGARSRRFAEAADAALAAGIDGGALHGVPVSVKDIYGLAGWATRAGSPKELPAPWTRDGPLIALLRRQFAVFTGKTHCVEFAFGGLGTNGHWPDPRNPWDPARVCGGSSSGAAASLADGSCLLAMGSDTAGSVRVPASMTGAVGLKTTAGRWPTGGIVPLSHTLDTAGILARSAADAWLAFAAIEEPSSSRLEPPEVEDDLGGFTVGVPRGAMWEDCGPGIAESVQQALGELEKAGARLAEIDFPEAGEALDLFRTGNLPATELHGFLAAELPDWLECLEPNTRGRIEAAKAISAVDYLARLRRLDDLSRRAAAKLADVDAVASPCVAITPPRFDEVATAADYRDANLKALRNTAVVNYLGLCALTLPVGLDAAGRPVGLQLMAAPLQEELLLLLALAIERRGGTPRQRLGRPPNGNRGLLADG
jgi:aspartyl-tRNA(Asn)/glutamyl-tRNA(Gln) amidotransferase subunit A